jgi:hypothetical protein
MNNEDVMNGDRGFSEGEGIVQRVLHCSGGN